MLAEFISASGNEDVGRKMICIALLGFAGGAGAEGVIVVES